VEQQRAHGFDDAAAGILNAHAASARDENGVAPGCRAADSLRHLRLAVLYNSAAHRYGAVRRQHGKQHGRVDVPHLPRSRRDLRGDELVAGGNNADPESSCHRNLNSAYCGQRAYILRGQQPSFFEHCLSREAVVPPEYHILSRRSRF